MLSAAWKKSILAREDEISQALKADLNKSPFESYMSETGMVLSEISYAKRHLKGWMKKKTRSHADGSISCLQLYRPRKSRPLSQPVFSSSKSGRMSFILLLFTADYNLFGIFLAFRLRQLCFYHVLENKKTALLLKAFL